MATVNLPKNDKMINHPCGFMIRESRFNQIVSSQVKQSLPADEDLEKKLQEEEDKL